jgi:hypothetical protein
MFVKYHLGLSCILSPKEARFMMHMVEIHHLTLWGYKTDYTRTEYMKRMGLGEHAFDTAAGSLTELGLVVRTGSRNSVHYALNVEMYDRLVEIVSWAQNVERLSGFLDFNLRKLGRSIDSITDGELDKLQTDETAEGES